MGGLGMPELVSRVLPILLLTGSNVFMTFAWYGHLAYREKPLWIVVMASWMIALPEYWLAVPANRYGSYMFSGAELKAIQEVITLSVFAVFSITYLGQPLTVNYVLGFALIALGAAFVFNGPF